MLPFWKIFMYIWERADLVTSSPLSYKVAQLNWCLQEDSVLMDWCKFLLAEEEGRNEWEFVVALFTLLSLAAGVLAEEIKVPYAPPWSLTIFLSEMFGQVPVV